MVEIFFWIGGWDETVHERFEMSQSLSSCLQDRHRLVNAIVHGYTPRLKNKKCFTLPDYLKSVFLYIPFMSVAGSGLFKHHLMRLDCVSVLQASLDEPTETVVLHRTEPSRLQSLALQLSDKVGSLVDNNEKIMEMKQGNFYPFQKGEYFILCCLRF